MSPLLHRIKLRRPALSEAVRQEDWVRDNVIVNDKGIWGDHWVSPLDICRTFSSSSLVLCSNVIFHLRSLTTFPKSTLTPL